MDKALLWIEIIGGALAIMGVIGGVIYWGLRRKLKDDIEGDFVDKDYLKTHHYTRTESDDKFISRKECLSSHNVTDQCLANIRDSLKNVENYFQKASESQIKTNDTLFGGQSLSFSPGPVVRTFEVLSPSLFFSRRCISENFS